MIRVFVLVLILLILPACSRQLVKDDLPESDLQALRQNAEADLAPRRLPNGKMYCFELSKTEGAQDECTGDLEDTLFKSEQDKARGLAGLIKDLDRYILGRNPCGFFAKMFRRDRCQVDNKK